MRADHQIAVFSAAMLIAVLGPAVSFGVLAHDLFVLGQDARCLHKARELVGEDRAADECNLPCSKLGTFHPRAWLYDEPLSLLLFENDVKTLEILNLHESLARITFRRHAWFAAASILPLLTLAVLGRRRYSSA